MEYRECLPFQAASAQGPERERKGSDKGSSSAVGENARSTICSCCHGIVALSPMSLGGTEYFPNLCRTVCYSLPSAQGQNCIPGLTFFQSSTSFLILLSTKICYFSIKLFKSQLLYYYCSLMNIIMNSIQYIF